MPKMVDLSRRDQEQVRIIAVLDMLLSLILFGFYLSVAFVTKIKVFEVPKGPFSPVTLIVISLIIWIIVFVLTYYQLSTAYRLFLVTFQDALGPHASVERSLAWLRLSSLLFVFIAFKIIFCYLRFENLIWFFWVLCVIELLIRFSGLYFVREFCDDLKHNIRITAQSPSNIKYDKASSVPQVIVSNHVEIEDV